MAKFTFKLLAGQHIQPDPDWKPSEQDLRTAERTGVAPRAPSRTYAQGDTVESDTDLAKKFGRDKFQLLSSEGRKASKGKKTANKETSGDPSEESMEKTPGRFPAGQVSTGFQESSSAPGGGTITGAKGEPDEKKERHSAPDADGDDDEGEADAEEETFTLERLESMKVPELRSLAQEKGIDLHGARTKEEIIDAIKSGAENDDGDD